jgi:two-component system chemotaxis response regulator CheY
MNVDSAAARPTIAGAITMSNRRVLSVGQCNFDHGNISQALHATFGADVTRAHGSEDALALLRQGGFDLVLINRVFDADGASGIELLRRIKSDETAKAVPVMLVSNFPDAQEQAVAAGAVPGFGKAALNANETVARLKEYLG